MNFFYSAPLGDSEMIYASESLRVMELHKYTIVKNLVSNRIKKWCAYGFARFFVKIFSK